MKSSIKSIILFSKEGEKRTVPLSEGVNIITGRSKTGKSALVEIIDYCFCSNRCTIPKGRITEFTSLYALVMSIQDNLYVIARQRWEDGGRMYVTRENENFDFNQLTLDYFTDKILILRNSAQAEIENALGLFVSKIVSDNNESGKKASLRNMVSYLFQHQNLIASKFALFYRFTDYYKRRDVIEQFPIFAGIISQEYYSVLIKLNELKAELKAQTKKQKSLEKRTKYIIENLNALLSDYFALLGNDFVTVDSIPRLRKIASSLPPFDESSAFDKDVIVERYDELKKQLEVERGKERELELKIANLKQSTKNGDSFKELLQELHEQSIASPIEAQNYTCPLCGNSCSDLIVKDQNLKVANDWLENELELTSQYTTDFSEEIRKYEAQKDEVINNIRKIWKQIKEIENKYLKSTEIKTKAEKANYAKAKINVFVEMTKGDIFIDDDVDIEILKNKISLLEEKIKGFDVETKKLKAQAFLSDNMNRLAQTLDFEEDFRPVDLNFGLVDGTFDMYQLQKNNERIYLSEMGSGANWVSCHLALFLSFLHYFAKQEKSPIPLIMFFDQPSQVYFPQGYDDQGQQSADIAAVNAMYKTVFDEVKNIESQTKILPQVIIVDHVKGDDLEISEEFNSYVKCNWLNEGALI